jgi:DNA-binding IclR family transcriptional regulator
MSTVERVLGLLDFFSEDRPIWSADELINRQSTSRATTYRDIKALVASGFIAPVAAGRYALGPRVIEMDRQMRLSDPLLRVAPLVMAAQRTKVGGTQLLCRYYGLRVMSVYEDRVDERIETRFDRGRPFPLFRGASSRVILAHLPQDQQKRLFLQHASEVAQAGLGDNWPSFRDRLRSDREHGVVIASDLNKHLVGIAAPIFVAPETVVGSLVLVRIKREVDAADLTRLTKLAIASARKVSDGVQAL